MSSELIVITQLIIQGDFKYSKCISCACKVYKSNDGYKCKKGHLHTTKSWEFYFKIFAVSLNSLKLLKKTLFGNSIKSILGFTASQVKDLDDSNLLILMKSLKDFLIGQIAFIRHKSSIITLFKLANSNTLLQFLQKQNLTITDPPLRIRLERKTPTQDHETHFYSIIDLVDYISWDEWFNNHLDVDADSKSDSVINQLSELKL